MARAKRGFPTPKKNDDLYDGLRSDHEQSTRQLRLQEESPFKVHSGAWCRNFYPLVNLQKTMERSTIFNGKIHYFYGHFQ